MENALCIGVQGIAYAANNTDVNADLRSPSIANRRAYGSPDDLSFKGAA